MTRFEKKKCIFDKMNETAFIAGDDETREKIRNRCIRKKMAYKDMYGRSKDMFIPGVQPTRSPPENTYGSQTVEKIPVRFIEDETQKEFPVFHDKLGYHQTPLFDHSGYHEKSADNESSLYTETYSPYYPASQSTYAQTPIPTCVDICNHVKSCPVCTVVHKSANGVLYVVIIIMSVIILILLKKILFTTS